MEPGDKPTPDQRSVRSFNPNNRAQTNTLCFFEHFTSDTTDTSISNQRTPEQACQRAGQPPLKSHQPQPLSSNKWRPSKGYQPHQAGNAWQLAHPSKSPDQRQDCGDLTQRAGPCQLKTEPASPSDRNQLQGGTADVPHFNDICLGSGTGAISSSVLGHIEVESTDSSFRTVPGSHACSRLYSKMTAEEMSSVLHRIRDCNGPDGSFLNELYGMDESVAVGDRGPFGGSP